jgi:hypothetical protein
MRLQESLTLVGGVLSIAVDAAPSQMGSRDDATTGIPKASLPQFDFNAKARAAAVAVRREGFVYGPSLIGEASSFLNGTLGNARVDADMALWQVDRNAIDAAVASDVKIISAAIAAKGGLKSLDDYVQILYTDQWKSSDPLAQAPGIMTNYTQDLLFSMERLSQNPFPLRLVKPQDPLPFQLADDLTTKIAGVTLKTLQASGSLFVVDRMYSRKI